MQIIKCPDCGAPVKKLAIKNYECSGCGKKGTRRFDFNVTYKYPKGQEPVYPITISQVIEDLEDCLRRNGDLEIIFRIKDSSNTKIRHHFDGNDMYDSPSVLTKSNGDEFILIEMPRMTKKNFNKRRANIGWGSL